MTTQKFKILEKWKKIPGYIILLHMCTIRDNRMMYGSWDMKRDGQNFLSFWTVFLPFYPPNNSKNQNFEKLKKTPGDIIILHMCTTNENHMVNGSWYIKRDGQIFLSFWTIFSPFTSLKSQKMKILEKWKNTWIYYDFTQVYQKSWSYDKVFLRYGAWRM